MLVYDRTRQSWRKALQYQPEFPATVTVEVPFMARMHRRVLLLALVSVAAAQEVLPNQPAATRPSHRPRIGVALEGGSAFGLAHIGVLEWFDEHHIPVDYIAGTSMGGLIGGFYATGMKGDDINKLLEHTDWDHIAHVTTPYQDLSFL